VPDIALRTGYAEARARRDAADYDVWLRTGVASADLTRAYLQPLKIRIPTPVVGSLSSVLDAATLVGLGTVRVVGTLATTLGAATLGGLGTVRITGTLSNVLAAASAAGVGTVRVAGALSVLLGDATLTARDGSGARSILIELAPRLSRVPSRAGERGFVIDYQLSGAVRERYRRVQVLRDGRSALVEPSPRISSVPPDPP